MSSFYFSLIFSIIFIAVILSGFYFVISRLFRNNKSSQTISLKKEKIIQDKDSVATSKNVSSQAKLDSGSSTTDQGLKESDNVGTRCETEDRGNVYFNTLFHKDPEPILFYFFDTKEKATEALSRVSCMAIAKDSGKLICTKILTFGVFPAVDLDDSRTWAALLAGKSLTYDLWLEARVFFKIHGGRMRREDEPPRMAPQKQKSTGHLNKVDTSVVTFVRDMDLKKQGGVGTKKIYKAPDKETALRFLKSQNTSRPFFYIEIETPAGWMGKDKDGVYEF